MNNQLTLYYSVENCGDGSAYPRFFDTKELAEWHQEHLDEGWGESCTGKVVVNGNNLSCQELQTKEGYYLNMLLDDYEDEIDEFVVQFFPDGLPEFTVGIIDDKYYGVFFDGKLVHKHFVYPEKKTNQESVARLTAIVNR